VQGLELDGELVRYVLARLEDICMLVSLVIGLLSLSLSLPHGDVDDTPQVRRHTVQANGYARSAYPVPCGSRDSDELLVARYKTQPRMTRAWEPYR